MSQIKNKSKVLASLADAVIASGKKFIDIPQNTIFAFFDKEGLPRTMWNEMYEKAKSSFEPTKKVEQTVNVKNVDYSDSSHNDVKTRQPRKSIFGEVKKIAG